jgi:hypothetical protein
MADAQTLAPGQLEALYSIVFDDRERTLLTHNEAMLNHLDGQRKYLLSRALEPHQCPGCNGVICQRSTGWSLGKSTADEDYMCPICSAKLTWHLAITGQTAFTLNPGQAIVIPPRPER